MWVFFGFCHHLVVRHLPHWGLIPQFHVLIMHNEQCRSTFVNCMFINSYMSFCSCWLNSILVQLNLTSLPSRADVIGQCSFIRNNKQSKIILFLQFIMKMYRGINGRTSGSGRGLQVHRTSWTRSDVGRRPARSCHTGSGCPWSPSWKPHPHLQQR